MLFRSAVAVGRQFTDILTEQLLDLGCFGLDDDQVRQMVRLGHADDDHGLIGIGRMLEHRFTHPSTLSMSRWHTSPEVAAEVGHHGD